MKKLLEKLESLGIEFATHDAVFCMRTLNVMYLAKHGRKKFFCKVYDTDDLDKFVIEERRRQWGR